MRIFITWGMPLIEKNAQTVCALEKVNNLKKIGEKVYFLSPNITKLPISTLPRLITLAFCQLFMFFDLFFKGTKLKPNVIHSSSALTLAPLIISKILNIPYVVEAHGIPSEDAKSVNTPRLIISLIIICEAISYKFSKKILANAPGTKRDIIERVGILPEKIIVIPNGANIDLFKPIKITKSDLGLDNRYNYICFVGNLATWQGIEYLIQSAPFILKKSPKTRFLIVGDGFLKNKLVKMVQELNLEDKFLFTGAVLYEEVPKYISVCDLCVAPFVRERDDKMSPLKIYEYMACEKPVVTSNIKGAGDIVLKNNAGIAVSPENPKELSRGILRLLQDKKLRELMGKNGRKTVVEKYSWKSIALKIDDIYKDLSQS